MRNDKVTQFIAGCVAIYFAWQMHVNGWFARIARAFSYMTDLFGSNDGLGGVSDLLIGLLPFMVDFICTVGIIAISFYTMIWKAAKPLCMKLLRLLDAKLEEHGVDLIDFDDERKN